MDHVQDRCRCLTTLLTDSMAFSRRKISSCSRCSVPVLPRCRAKAAAQAEWMLLTQFSSSTWHGAWGQSQRGVSGGASSLEWRQQEKGEGDDTKRSAGALSAPGAYPKQRHRLARLRRSRPSRPLSAGDGRGGVAGRRCRGSRPRRPRRWHPAVPRRVHRCVTARIRQRPTAYASWRCGSPHSGGPPTESARRVGNLERSARPCAAESLPCDPRALAWLRGWARQPGVSPGVSRPE